MLKKAILFLSIFGLSTLSQSQIISQFTWDSGLPTSADVGPDAISISSSAITDINGVGGTNGLNAGLPKRDVAMVIPGSPTFDIEGIDISFDYQRDESIGTFFQRGSSLIIRGCNKLSVSFRVEDGFGGFTTVNSGSVYSIPNDNTFRTYRFYYLPSTGEANLLVDGVSVWSNDGPDGQNLYWTGAGNVQVGGGMDGTGFNRTFLDNLIIASVFGSPLPIELLSFDLNKDVENEVICLWETASERNNDFFTIERSADGLNWESLRDIDGAGNSVRALDYNWSDNAPLAGLSYYRLKQTDFDGSYTYSPVRSIETTSADSFGNFSFYPNPATDLITVQFHNETRTSISPRIFNSAGQLMLIAPESTSSIFSIDLSGLQNGIYFLIIGDQSERLVIRN